MHSSGVCVCVFGSEMKHTHNNNTQLPIWLCEKSEHGLTARGQAHMKSFENECVVCKSGERIGCKGEFFISEGEIDEWARDALLITHALCSI